MLKLEDIKRVACFGTGVIGASWATNFVMKGLDVNLYDISEEQLSAGKQKIADNLAFLVKKECLTQRSR